MSYCEKAWMKTKSVGMNRNIKRDCKGMAVLFPGLDDSFSGGHALVFMQITLTRKTHYVKLDTIMGY